MVNYRLVLKEIIQGGIVFVIMGKIQRNQGIKPLLLSLTQTLYAAPSGIILQSSSPHSPLPELPPFSFPLRPPTSFLYLQPSPSMSEPKSHRVEYPFSLTDDHLAGVIAAIVEDVGTIVVVVMPTTVNRRSRRPSPPLLFVNHHRSPLDSAVIRLTAAQRCRERPKKLPL